MKAGTKNLFFLLLLLCFNGCGPVISVSASFAKEFCSCYFVERLTKSYCEEYATFLISMWDYKLDENKKSVTSKFLWATSQSLFISDRHGCQLQ